MYAKRDFKIEHNASGVITNANLIVNGGAIDCSNADYNGYTITFNVLKTNGVGTVQIEKIEGSDDVNFATGVVVFDNSNSIDHFGKSDTQSSVDALSQTIVSTNYVVKCLDFHPKIKKQYYRPVIKITGATNLDYVVFSISKQKTFPVNQ
jgi:hypothetical protein